MFKTVDECLVPVQQFLYREGHLLDSLMYKEWLELFTEDGFYWIPHSRGQKDPKMEPSIIYENKELLQMRIKRLADDKTDTYLAIPRPYTVHNISNVYISYLDSNYITVSSSLFVLEYHDEKKRLFGGKCTHKLSNKKNDLKIKMKRVDLVDCDAIHNPFLSLL